MKQILFLFILLPALSYSQVLMQGGIKADTAEVIATKTTAKNGGLYMGSGKTPNSDTVEVLVDKGLTFKCKSDDGFTNIDYYNQQFSNGVLYPNSQSYSGKLISNYSLPFDPAWHRYVNIVASGEENYYKIQGSYKSEDPNTEKGYNAYYFPEYMSHSSYYNDIEDPGNSQSCNIDFSPDGPFITTNNYETFAGIRYEEPYPLIMTQDNAIPCLGQIKQLISDSVSTVLSTNTLVHNTVNDSFNVQVKSFKISTYNNPGYSPDGYQSQMIFNNRYDGTGIIPSPGYAQMISGITDGQHNPVVMDFNGEEQAVQIKAFDGPNISAMLGVNNGGIYMFQNNKTFEINNTGAIFTDGTGTGKGLQYYSDYSASLVNNDGSLTDVRTVKKLSGRKVSAVLDFPSTAAGTFSELTFSTSATNSPAGSSITIGFSSAPEIGVFSGYCITAGSVKIRYYNPTAAAIDPTSKTYYLYLVSPN